MSEPARQAAEPTAPDPEETIRFNLQAIINFIEVKPRSDLSPGAQESLSWAISAACDAARRIFAAMDGEADH